VTLPDGVAVPGTQLDGLGAEADAELHHPRRGGWPSLLTLKPLILPALLVGDATVGLGQLLLLHSFHSVESGLSSIFANTADLGRNVAELTPLAGKGRSREH
jgi:hypothetical protein